MPTYAITVNVDYYYEVEADSAEEAERAGWEYEDYSHTAEVYAIKVAELDSEDEDEDE